MEAPDGGLAPVEIALADGTIFQATTNGLMRSRDMGATWTAAAARVAGTLALTADAMFLTEGREIARSTDGGSTWTPFARAPAHVQQLTVAADQRTLLVTTDTGRLVSRDAGATWTFFDVFPANIPVESGGRLATGADGTVAVWTNSGLALSSDGGATWRSTAPVDDPGAIERFVLDPAQPDTIYLGQRRGRAPAYRSTDGGRTWTSWAIVVPPRQPGGAEETPPVVDGTWRLGFSALVIAPSAPQTMYAIALGDVVGSTEG
jgi:photosystem II stability/assembly factor-like uncharacterized protein